MNSIEKALEILRAFTPNNRPLRSVEISHRLKMNKATVNRILVTLRKRGFVVQDEPTRRYRLGPSTALLGRAVKQSLSGRLVAMAKPYLDDLRDKVDESVHHEVLTGSRIFLAYSAPGVRQVTVTPRVGDQMAINANVRGTMLCCQAAGQDMIKRGEPGSSITVGSIRGFPGHPAGYSAYGTSKGAVHLLTKQLAC